MTTTQTPLGDAALRSTARWIDRGDLAYLAYLLLPLRAYLWLGRVAGWLEMLVRPRARDAVRANLAKAFGTQKSARELDQLTRQVFEFHQVRILLVLIAPLLAASDKLAQRFPLRHLELLDQAIAGGKGAIIVGSHVNSMGILLAIVQLRRLGYDIRVPMPDPQDAWPLTPFRRLVHRIVDAKTFAELIGAHYAQFNVRPIIKLLDRGVVVLLMADGWHSASFVDADFLGRRLPFTNAPLSVARLAGVPVVPLFAVGQPHRMHFEFETPFHVTREGALNEDLERKVRFFISRVEQRMLADIPSWQHWMVDDVFGTLEVWRDKPISERYAV